MAGTPPPDRPPLSDTRSEREGRRRVLVVDDEPLIGRLIERLLEAEHRVQSVTSAGAALQSIRAGERFEVILCDLMMPQMTGMAFYETLRAEEPQLAERIVFMTGGAFTEKAREFLSSRRTVQLEKPFNGASLRQAVASVPRG